MEHALQADVAAGGGGSGATLCERCKSLQSDIAEPDTGPEKLCDRCMSLTEEVLDLKKQVRWVHASTADVDGCVQGMHDGG